MADAPPQNPESPLSDLDLSPYASQWEKLVSGGTPKDQATAQIMQQIGQDRVSRAHAEFRSGRLQRMTKAENAADTGNAEDSQDVDRTATRAKVLGTFAAPAIGAGAEPLMAAAAAPAAGGYRKGYEAVHGAEQSVNPWLRVPLEIGGAAVAQGAGTQVAGKLAPMASGPVQRALQMAAKSPAVVAATHGAATNLADADPDRGGGSRMLGAAVTAPLGYAGAKLGELLPVAAAAKTAPDADALFTAAKREAAKSKPLYQAFRKLGDLAGPQSLTDAMNFPLVQEALGAVQKESPTLAKLVPTDARVLDAIYKKVGSAAFKQAAGITKDDARVLLKWAIEEGANAQGGSYVAPLEQFAEGMTQRSGVKLGRGAAKLAQSGTGGSDTAVEQLGPSALRRFAASPTTSDAATKMAQDALLSQIGRQGVFSRIPFTRVPIPMVPSRGLRITPELLQALGRDPSLVQRVLQSVGGASGASVPVQRVVP